MHTHIHTYMAFLSKMKQTHWTSDNFEKSKECDFLSITELAHLYCMHNAPYAGKIHSFACNAFNVLANILFVPSRSFRKKTMKIGFHFTQKSNKTIELASKFVVVELVWACDLHNNVHHSYSIDWLSKYQSFNQNFGLIWWFVMW